MKKQNEINIPKWAKNDAFSFGEKIISLMKPVADNQDKRRYYKQENWEILNVGLLIIKLPNDGPMIKNLFQRFN